MVAGRSPIAGRSRAGSVEVAGIELTHPDRILFADQGLTKRDLATYYVQVAEAMLPHVVGRPITIVRCPSGRKNKCFYQKHPGSAVPETLKRVTIEEKSGTHDYLLVSNVRDLVSLVQIGMLEIHLWGARADDLDHPDRIVFDVDPGPGVAWKKVTEAAAELRERLRQMRLESFLKTTGGKGLHVVVPVAPIDDWSTLKAFAKAIAVAMEQDAPDTYTTALPKAARAGRIFIDYLRNDRGATAVAPFSTRARAGAPVATPLAWTELGPQLRSGDLNVVTVPERLRTLDADPWKGLLRLHQKITAKARAELALP